MKKESILIFAIFFGIVSISKPEKIKTAKVWQPVELSFSANLSFKNAYLETIHPEGKPFLYAEFSCTECKPSVVLRIPGFWNGGNSWKIRFSPPGPGNWTYKTISSDKGLDEKKGLIQVSGWTEVELKNNPCRRGLISVNNESPRNGRYFVYSDGTPFLWIGDTWWNWTKSDIPVNIFKNLIDVRSEQGFTIGQLFFPGNGWGPSASMLDSSYSLPDLDHIRNVEEMIRYANEKGITVWIHGWWCRDQMNVNIGEEKIIRWWKYIISRLQSYNVIWVLAGEYNMYNYGDLGIDFWNRLGNIVEAEDPYSRIISVHPTPPGWEGGDEADQWSTSDVIHEQSWLKYNQSQVGHGKWRNEMIPWVVKKGYNLSPAKPIVVTEPWYEFIEGNPSAMDIRYGAWTAFLSGAAGHSYGGGHVWRAHVPGSPSSGDSWPLEERFDVNTLNYPGALSLSYMSKFLGSIAWWKLEPHAELVSENPSQFCSADIGNEYLIYLRYGGKANIDLGGNSGNEIFNIEWIDLTKNESVKRSKIHGGNNVILNIPEDYPGELKYKDWLIHIFK